VGQLVRTWLGLCALGAGMVHLAVAAGSAPVLLALFVGIGVAELAWGVSALAKPDLLRPGLAIYGALLPIAVWLALLLGGSGSMSGMSGMTTQQMPSMAPVLPAGAMLGATALDLVLAVGLALVLRRAAPRAAGERHEQVGPSEEPAAQQERPWRFLIGVLAGAAVVAVVTANSLAATPVGAGGMAGMGH
jgi:hypothetical protein